MSGRLRSERGSVVVGGLLLGVALALLIGTAVDIAHAFILRAELTAIADDAALAGAGEVDVAAWREGRLALDPHAARRAAQDELAATSGVGSVVSASSGSVSVEVERSFSPGVLRLLGIPTVTIRSLVRAFPRTP